MGLAARSARRLGTRPSAPARRTSVDAAAGHLRRPRAMGLERSPHNAHAAVLASPRAGPACDSLCPQSARSRTLAPPPRALFLRDGTTALGNLQPLGPRE